MRSRNLLKLVAVGVVLGFLGSLGAALRAQDNEAPPAGPKRLSDYDIPGLDEKVNLTSIDVWDVVQLIEFLAHRGGLNNIVIGQGVAGLTTKLKFDGVTVGDALEVVLSVNNLAYEVKGGIITIMTDTEYQKARGTSFYDNKQVRVVDLKYADPSRVAAMLGPVKSSIGTVISDPITGTLILIDTPEKIAEMRSVIEKADLATVSRIIPTETRTFVLQYADLADVQGELTSLLTPETGTLRVDRRTRTLLVTDLAHKMPAIEELVQLFDQRPRQVFIEAKIVEVTLSDNYNLGINWNHVVQGLDPRFALTMISKPGLPAAPNAATLFRSGADERVSGGTLMYSTIVGGQDLNAVIQALKTVGETKILSNPQIAVLDGQEATIEVIEDQPYKEVTLESGTTNITGVTYLFKKIGVTLAVTPRINQEDMISVAIKPEVSSISQWYDGEVQEGTPVIRKSLAETTVMVKDGVTVIIGGLIRNEKSASTSRIPVLGAIPLLGMLFRSESETIDSKETVVFMTPRIISGEEPFLRLQDMKKEPKPLRTIGREVKALKPVR